MFVDILQNFINNVNMYFPKSIWECTVVLALLNKSEFVAETHLVFLYFCYLEESDRVFCCSLTSFNLEEILEKHKILVLLEI